MGALKFGIGNRVEIPSLIEGNKDWSIEFKITPLTNEEHHILGPVNYNNGQYRWLRVDVPGQTLRICGTANYGIVLPFAIKVKETAVIRIVSTSSPETLSCFKNGILLSSVTYSTALGGFSYIGANGGASGRATMNLHYLTINNGTDNRDYQVGNTTAGTVLNDTVSPTNNGTLVGFTGTFWLDPESLGIPSSLTPAVEFTADVGEQFVDGPAVISFGNVNVNINITNGSITTQMPSFISGSFYPAPLTFISVTLIQGGVSVENYAHVELPIGFSTLLDVNEQPANFIDVIEDLDDSIGKAFLEADNPLTVQDTMYWENASGLIFYRNGLHVLPTENAPLESTIWVRRGGTGFIYSHSFILSQRGANMSQTPQNKAGIWLPNPAGPKYDSTVPAGGRNAGYHGMRYRVESSTLNFGSKTDPGIQVHETFKHIPNGGALAQSKPKWLRKDGGLTTYGSNLQPRYPNAKCVRSRPGVDGEFATNYHKFRPSKAVRVHYFLRLDNFDTAYDLAMALKLGRICSTFLSGGGGFSETYSIATVADNTDYSITLGANTFTINSGTGATAATIARALAVKLQTDNRPWKVHVASNRVVVEYPPAEINEKGYPVFTANLSRYARSRNGGYYNGIGCTSLGGTVLTSGFLTNTSYKEIQITGGSGSTYTFTPLNGAPVPNGSLNSNNGAMFVVAGTGIAQRLTSISNTGTSVTFSPAPAIALDNTSVLRLETNDQVYLSTAFSIDSWQEIVEEIYLATDGSHTGFHRVYINGELRANIENIRGVVSGVPYLHDSFLLGTMMANYCRFYVPKNLTANTTYSITLRVGATTYTVTYTSGASVPTISEICNGLKANAVSQGVTNGGDFIVDRDGLGISTHFNNTLTLPAGEWDPAPRVPSIMNGDVQIDVGEGNDQYVKGFFITDTADWGTSTKHYMQPFDLWTNTACEFPVFAPSISGDKHLWYRNGSGVNTYLGVLSPNGLTVF